MVNAPEVDPRSCPSPAELAAFLCDELSPVAMDGIGAHVSSCNHCDVLLRRMDEATDASLKALLERPLNEGSGLPPTDPEYRRMIAAARTLVPTPPPPQNILPPSQLGQYRIGERLGQGGMGAVYRAEHVRLKKSVAVKVLSPGQTRDPRAVARFQLEMEVVGRLDHPNIVRATDAGEADGVYFLVMELISGVNLAHLLLRCGPLPVAEACELVRQAAVGLQSAHELGLVHRDVKPSNLMLSATGQVKLLDLGLALLRGDGPGAGDLTGVGEVMGTAEYMAPEQWDETHSVDIRADIYSLGCTLYALLAGDPPFTGSGRRSFLRMMSAHQQGPVRPITDHRPDVPPALCELLDRMLAKSPDARPATPGALAAELQRFVDGANLSALSASAPPDAKTIANRARPAPPTPTPTPVSLPTVSAPVPARSGRRLLLVTLVVAVGTIGACVYSIVSAPAPAGLGAAAPNNEPPDPKKWRNLLAERHDERFKRLWRPTVESVLDHKRAEEVLTVQTLRPALIRLGDAPTAGYKLQIGFRQVRWQGGIGVYFGGRTKAPPNEFVFQFVALQRTNLGKGQEFRLGRFRGQYLIELNPKPGINTLEFQKEYVPAPDNGEKLLELEVRPGGLASVRWDGSACPQLVGADALADAQRLFPDGGLTGEFGIYCNGSVVTVTTARYIPTE